MSIIIYRNSGLPDEGINNQTSTVGETNIANKGREVFFTGNWYASRSLNSGSSWEFVSPTSTLPSASAGFCCDQTVIYEPKRDLMIWVLQYRHDANSNTLRVAVKHGSSLATNDWHWWDFSPTMVNSSWAGEWFDYNHVAVSDNYLYVGTNVFTIADDRFTRGLILRFPLNDLVDGSSLTYSHFATTSSFSMRCTNGAKDIMYIAAHNNNTRQLRLYAWPENTGRITARVIDVNPWNGTGSGRYSAPGPDGNDWLSRTDSRITGAWFANGIIGVAWTANRKGNRPYPHIRVVRIDATTMRVIDQPDIWHTQYAYAYPAVYPNGRGVVGLTAFRGGGTMHPGHLVGVFDDMNNRWKLKATRNSTHTPSDGKWGDYVDIFPYSGKGNSWLVSGFTLQGGASRREIVPQFVRFYVRGM